MPEAGERVRPQSGVSSAIAAFRKDAENLPPNGRSPAREGAWLALASLLEHGNRLPTDERGGTRAAFERLLEEVHHSSPLIGGPSLDPPTDDAGAAVGRALRAVAEEMEEAGALRLARCMLGAYVAAGFAADPLDEGRCDALRARLAWKLGHLDESLHGYQALERAGRRHKLPELRTRAWLGFAIVARLRGNYPDSREWAARAAAAADRLRLRALAQVAVHTQLVGAAVAGDFDSALVFGWRGYRDALGDPVREAEMLITLAQLLLDIGYPRLALRGFAAALERKPLLRFMYPALGGAALAAGRLQLRELVSHYARALQAVGQPAGLPYQYASAQLDLARAFSMVGLDADVEHWSTRARAVATEFGFHEIEHYARQLAEPVPLAQREARNAASSTSVHQALRPDAIEVLDAVGSLAVSDTAVVG
jgi:hypothetical protein